MKSLSLTNQQLSKWPLPLLIACNLAVTACNKKKEVAKKDDATEETPVTRNNMDFTATTQAYPASDYSQLLTAGPYASIHFTSPDQGVVVSAGPDDDTIAISREFLGSKGKVIFEDENGNLVEPDKLSIVLSVYSDTVTDPDRVRVIITELNEVGTAVRSSTVAPTEVDNTADGITTITISLRGGSIAFAPLLLASGEDEVEGFTDQETVTDSTPEAPTLMAGTAISTTQVNLSWTVNASTEASFEIQRSTDNVTYSALATKAANTTIHSDTTVVASTGYYFRIRACNTFGCSAYATSSLVTTLDNFHTIFITSTSYTGNLGGLSGADAKCQTQASAAGRSGTWKAIISGTGGVGEWARNRVTVVGEVRNTNGVKVADNSADLWDSSLDAAIGYNENAVAVTGHAWTASFSDGQVDDDAFSCNGWTLTTANDQIGYSQATNATWLNGGVVSCSATYRLFCINGQQ